MRIKTVAHFLDDSHSLQGLVNFALIGVFRGPKNGLPYHHKICVSNINKLHINMFQETLM